MRENPVQFAVVREDPAVERALVEGAGARRALIVASGGCTALALRTWCPDVDLTLVDFNPAQLDLVERKFAALAGSGVDRALWTIGVDDPTGLNACGNFESLFRSLRRFVEDLVVPRDELVAALSGEADLGRTTERITGSPYWAQAFEVHFADGLLRTMFGDAAVQHAPADGYPTHFRRAYERGLARADATGNRFLHHLLLGHYLEHALPPYLVEPRPLAPPRAVLGTPADVDDLGTYDLISLSNVTDWMSPRESSALVGHLSRGARPGATLVLRVLGSAPHLRAALADAWTLDDDFARELHARDQSLFYSDLLVARKRPLRP